MTGLLMGIFSLLVRLIIVCKVKRLFCFVLSNIIPVAETDDYFGIDLLLNQLHPIITVVLDTYLSKYTVLISSDSDSWVCHFLISHMELM